MYVYTYTCDDDYDLYRHSLLTLRIHICNRLHTYIVCGLLSIRTDALIVLQCTYALRTV